MHPFDSTFRHAYEVVTDHEVSQGDSTILYFPGATASGGKDGIVIHVVASGAKRWTGVFAFGGAAPYAVSGVYACPNESQLCVVSRGNGYIVNTLQPSESEVLPLQPILQVIPVALQKRLLFVDYTGILAYGVHGVAWRSDGLAWDALRIKGVGERDIVAEGWDAPTNQNVEFLVDLASGRRRTDAGHGTSDRL